MNAKVDKIEVQMADCEKVLQAAKKYIDHSPELSEQERQSLREAIERSQPLIIRAPDLFQCLEAAAELITSPLGGLFAMEYKRAFNRIIHPIKRSYQRKNGEGNDSIEH